MKNRALLSALVLLMGVPLGLWASAPAGRADVRSETLSQQREQYQKGVEDELKRLRHEIAALQARAPKNGDALRKQFDQQMAELTRKRDLAERKCAQLEKSGQKAWQEMKPGLDAAVKDLQQAYQRAVGEFK